MNLLNRFKLPAMAGILLVVGFISSCEQELTTIGEGVIGGEPFTTDKVVYEVRAFNKKIEAVQTNQLPVYQLGVYDDPVYGKTEATITTQVQLASYNPTFGTYTQEDELLAQAGLKENDTIPENETIDSVVVYLPFLNGADSDSDGVPDSLELGDDILDATNDSDNDGVANNVEVAAGTDPLNSDTDGDGILDDVDDLNDETVSPRRVGLDSIYGNRNQEFTFKIEKSNYFLRDLDPNSNFQDAQEYYSNQQFSPEFTEEVFYEGLNTISDLQTVVITTEDDLDTDDEDETVKTPINPGIRVQLDAAGINFFQENILDKEGSVELLNASNFKEFFRGIYLSVAPAMSESELLFLLDLSSAQVEVYYNYDDLDDDDVVVKAKSSFIMSLASATIGGNAVNTLINEEYPSEITNAMDVDPKENASRIYLKGGAGSFAEIELFENDAEIEQLKSNNWIINEARLVFNIDQAALGANVLEPQRLYLYNAETNEPLYNAATDFSDDISALGIYPNYDGVIEESNGRGLRYTISITEYINDIIVRDAVNATLGLQVASDIRITGSNNTILATGEEKELPASAILTPLGTILYGSNIPTDDANRLQLEIYYTETN